MTEREEMDQFILEAWAVTKAYAPRAVRALGYMLIAILLLSVVKYPIGSVWFLAIAIGLLGFGSHSARIGQVGIAALLVMAIFPPDIIRLVATVH